MKPNNRTIITQRAQRYRISEEGKAVRLELLKMVESSEYNTASTFSPSAENGVLLFVDKHMNFLSTHLTTSSEQYLSNLRLITKIRA